MNDGNNRVEVDAERIEAEMAAAVEAAPDTATGAAVDAPPVPTEPAASAWAPTMPAAVMVIDRFIMPNWKLTELEKEDLSGALAAVLDDLFPGGLGSEKWAPYFRLLAVGAGIAFVRYDGEKGFPPLHVEAEPEKGSSGVVHDQAA